jgi:hypothetical protein
MFDLDLVRPAVVRLQVKPYPLASLERKDVRHRLVA